MLKGSLHDTIHTPSESELPWVTRVQILIDSCLGMTYLHQTGILHHDLKSPNLLMGPVCVCVCVCACVRVCVCVCAEEHDAPRTRARHIRVCTARVSSLNEWVPRCYVVHERMPKPTGSTTSARLLTLG